MTPTDAKRILMQEFGLTASITAQATAADVLLYVKDNDTRFAVIDNAATHRIEQYQNTAGWWLTDDHRNHAQRESHAQGSDLRLEVRQQRE